MPNHVLAIPAYTTPRYFMFSLRFHHHSFIPRSSTAKRNLTLRWAQYVLIAALYSIVENSFSKSVELHV
jgi:hypothetical protein